MLHVTMKICFLVMCAKFSLEIITVSYFIFFIT